MLELFKRKVMIKGLLSEKIMLLDRFHVIAIFPEKCLIKDWKKRYKSPTSWSRFMSNKSRRSNFDRDYLESVKNIVYALGDYMNEIGDVVYYRKNCPLLINIRDHWFIGIAPIIKGIDY